MRKIFPIVLLLFFLLVVFSGCNQKACNNNGTCETKTGETTENCPNDCITKQAEENCSVLGGQVCESPGVCNGKFVAAIDTQKCCIDGTCITPAGTCTSQNGNICGNNETCFGTGIFASDTNKCCNGNCIIKTCSEQGGNICSENKNCNGNIIPANDSIRCCNALCELKTCAEQSGYNCTENQTCTTQFISAQGTDKCCASQCTTKNPCNNNGACDAGENSTNCPSDCPATASLAVTINQISRFANTPVTIHRSEWAYPLPAVTESAWLYPYPTYTYQITSTNINRGKINLETLSGQIVTFSVLLRNDSGRNATFTVDKEDLLNGSNKIPKENIEEFAVYVLPKQKHIDWENIHWGDNPAGANWCGNVPFTLKDTPELLVKGGNTNFMDPNITRFLDGLTNKDGFLQSDPNANSGKIRVTINNGEIKQFFFRINIPSGIAAGKYEGKITFNEVDVANPYPENYITASIQVSSLPTTFTKSALLSGNNRYLLGCFQNDFIRKGSGDTGITADVFDERLNVLKYTGCDAMILRMYSGPDGSDNLTALKKIIEKGFAGPIVLNYSARNAVDCPGESSKCRFSTNQLNYFKTMVTEIRDAVNGGELNGLPPLLWFVIDEANAGNAFSEYKIKVGQIKGVLLDVFGNNDPNSLEEVDRANGNTMLRFKNYPSIYYEVFADISYGKRLNFINAQCSNYTSYGVIDSRCSGTSPPANVCNYSCAGSMLLYGYGTVASNTTPIPNLKYYEGYYWQGYNEMPLTNRYLGGFGLVNTSVKTGLKVNFMNPVYGYYGIDRTSLFSDDIGQDFACHKKMLTYYPASNGFIPTLQSEGWREGIVDATYYYNFKALAEKCMPSHQAQTDSMLTDIQTRLNAFQYYGKPNTLPNGITETSFDDLRKTLGEDLTTLGSWNC